MDAQSRLDESIALVAFVRALVEFLRTEQTERAPLLPRALPWWLEKENKYQASRRGLEARYIAHEDGRVEKLVDVVEATFEAVAPAAKALGDTDHYERARALARSPGYQRQRQVWALNQSTEEVVAALADVIAS